MADSDTTTGGKPGDGGTPSQAAAQQAQQPNVTDAKGGKPADGVTPPPADDYAELRAALGKERDARDAAEKRLKAIEEKDLPEAERQRRRLEEAERENADLKAALKREQVSSVVIAEASKLGFADPADAVRFLDFDAIETDAKGQPRGVEAQLKSVLASKPYLASAAARVSGSVDQGRRGSAPPTNDFERQIRTSMGAPVLD